MRQFLRYAALYALIELLVVALLVWAFGIGWALAVLAAAFIAGAALAASQLKAQVAALKNVRDPRRAVADGALVGLGAVLVFLPGMVTTVAGTLMLAPPTRGAMRPMAGALLARGVTRRITRRDYIDGEVISEINEDAVALTQ